jgi:hypothetical protein
MFGKPVSRWLATGVVVLALANTFCTPAPTEDEDTKSKLQDLPEGIAATEVSIYLGEPTSKKTEDDGTEVFTYKVGDETIEKRFVDGKLVK